MSRPCRDCGDPIDWADRGGRRVPVNPGGDVDHRETCVARRGQVPDRLKRPSRHHTSASKIKRHAECQAAYRFEVIDRLEGAQTEAQDAGKLAHDAIEVVAVERAKARDLARPVTVAELHAGLDVAAGRQPWSAESLTTAREVLERAAARIDLADVVVDEHGPWVERGFELPVGEGIVVGGVLDLVERVGGTVIVRDWKTGGFREPRPETLPAVGLYAAWARLLWPGAEVRVVLSYLALDQEDEVAGPKLDAATEHALAVARALVQKTRARAEDPGAWPGTFGPHCARCPFSARCPTFASRVGSAVATSVARPSWRPVEELDADEAVAEAWALAPAAAVLDARVKALRKRALALVAPVVDPFGRAVLGLHPVRLKKVERKGYTVEPTVYQVLEIEDPLVPVEAAVVAPRGELAITPGPGAPPTPHTPPSGPATPLLSLAAPTVTTTGTVVDVVAAHNKAKAIVAEAPAPSDLAGSPAAPPPTPPTAPSPAAPAERDPRQDPRAGDVVDGWQVVEVARKGRGWSVQATKGDARQAVSLSQWRQGWGAKAARDRAADEAATPPVAPTAEEPVAAASPAPSETAVLVDALARVAAEDAKERDALVNEPAGGGAHVAGAAQAFGPGPASEGAHLWE